MGDGRRKRPHPLPHHSRPYGFHDSLSLGSPLQQKFGMTHEQIIARSEAAKIQKDVYFFSYIIRE